MSAAPLIPAFSASLENWTEVWNEHAEPFKWTRTADQIIDRICRRCSRIFEPARWSSPVRNSWGERGGPAG